jgi:CHAT domain-containing protein
LLDELRNVASVPEFLLFDTVAGADLGQRADALIAPLVRSRSAAVYYLLTPVDTLITWLVLPSKAVRVYKQSVTTAELIRLIIEFRRLLYADSPQTLGLPDGSRIAERANTENSMEAADSVGKRLTDILLPEDVLDSLHSYTDIVIIPHGVLSMLPFAALPSDPVGVPLGIRFAIRYSPSLSLLSVASPRLTNQNGGATLRPALIVADPKMPVDPTSGDPFDPLGMSRVAAQSLARRLGTTALVDSVATETTIRQRMLSGRLIHLATHGVAYGSAEDSRRSFVVLARDSVNDGLLSVGEILDDSHLQLEGAELVVLSACQTGLGRVTLGEGTLGFQRAFLARGARRVLVSLWSVSEDATMFLLDRFYTHLLDASGQVSYSAALQKAQEDTRSRPEYQNPFFWAGFQLVGAP